MRTSPFSTPDVKLWMRALALQAPLRSTKGLPLVYLASCLFGFHKDIAKLINQLLFSTVPWMCSAQDDNFQLISTRL